MEKYQAQLTQVNSALTRDPENQKLLLLKSKLEQILSLKTDNEPKGNLIDKHGEQPLDFPLQVGEACEIYDEVEKYWKPGNIVSMTLERDFYIISFSKDNKTQRVSASKVRRMVHREEKKSQKKLSNKMIQKPQTFRPKKAQPEPEGPNQWKKFADKMIKK